MTDDAVGFLCAYAEWFEARMGRKPKALEFGMGASTLFLIDRVGEIVSFEHDKEWYERVVRLLQILDLSHPKAILAERPYSGRIAGETAGSRFDLISIDGRDRVACLREVLRQGLLETNGILVLDNTERITKHNGRYAEMAEMLRPDFKERLKNLPILA